MKGQPVAAFREDRAVMDLLGLTSGQYRIGVLEVPTTGLGIDLIEFKGVDRRVVRANIQDPGSTRVQIQVRDVEQAIAAITPPRRHVSAGSRRARDQPAGVPLALDGATQSRDSRGLAVVHGGGRDADGMFHSGLAAMRTSPTVTTVKPANE